MDFSTYLKELEAFADVAYLGANREKELAYIRRNEWRFRRLLANIPSVAGSQCVLDIDATPFPLMLQKVHPNWEVWAMDRTGHLKERFERVDIPFRACDLDQLHMPLEDGLFDLVICTEVLEHIFALPTEVLREVFRVMRPSGTLLLSVPNLANLRKRVRFLFGVSPLENPDTQLATHPLHGHGHVREYTRSEVVSVCRSAGFEVEHVRMEWKSPSDIVRMIVKNCRELLRRGFYVAKLLHALLNTVTPSIRGNILVTCRKPALPAPRDRSERKAA